MYHGVLFFGNVANSVLVSCFADPDAANHEMCPETGGCAGDDSVVVARIALRFREPLFAARRATVPVRMFGSISVIRGDNRFCLDGRFMERPIPKVNHFLWVAEGETTVACVAFVPSISRCGGIASLKPVRHVEIPDFSRPTSVPDTHELVVPA